MAFIYKTPATLNIKNVYTGQVTAKFLEQFAFFDRDGLHNSEFEVWPVAVNTLHSLLVQ